MASSAFSFHCMICFEEFDPVTNYPVVLPCGHTYVCIECANRLDKCTECRAPLFVKVGGRGHDVCPLVGGGPAPVAAAAIDPAPLQSSSSKENAPGNAYADRVLNSPGFRRRYGHRREYRKEYRGGRAPPPQRQQPHQQQQQQHPPAAAAKRRLPLPKNVVLLSLMQASEPARRAGAPPPPPAVEAEAEEDAAPSTPARSRRTNPPAPSEAPSPSSGGGGRGGTPLLASSTSGGRPSPLAGGAGRPSSAGGGAGGCDEEWKIRVGTHLEGGMCGTYAVAAKDGLLVYPTLFERALPPIPNILPSASKEREEEDEEEEEEDAVDREVEALVARHRSRSAAAAAPPPRPAPPPAARLRPGGGATEDESPDSFLGWAEHRPGDEDVEVRPSSSSSSSALSPSTDRKVVATSASEGDVVSSAEPSANEERDEDDDERRVGPGVRFALDEDGGGSGDDDDDAEEDVGASVRSLPWRRSRSSSSASARASSGRPPSRDDSDAGTTPREAGRRKGDRRRKRFARHFSQGNAEEDDGDGDRGVADDEFDRPLVRLRHGDRVQVVSADGRGWVKLARGHGYIRPENEKQLVKVGGTSDKACQIEAMLHELSMERSRLKHEQTKLERLSAGLMIDLQSTLLTSDDHVIVHAPKDALARSQSFDSPARNASNDAGNASADGGDVSSSSPKEPTLVQIPHHGDGIGQENREIRTSKSYSPGRTSSLGGAARAPKTPPSPPFGQVSSNVFGTPTRVNFRTGMSGHRALTSSYSSHSHDVADDDRSTIRSMSNHAGVIHVARLLDICSCPMNTSPKTKPKTLQAHCESGNLS
ncbi:hypothetical protein ACHAWF_012691 [Thalassiosira exigua]